MDVAFGGKQSIHPLRLDMNEETQTVSDGLFRTRAVDDGYTLIETKNSNNESSWRSLYKFRDETAESVDCEMGNFWTSNYPTSRFCTQFFISRRVGVEGVGVEGGRDEFHYILNNSYVATAKTGDAGAQYDLGLYYHQGIRGLTQSSKRAFEYYTLAANQGFANAQYNLGFMYAIGEGIETSYSKARKWWTKAAAQGDDNAINGLKQLDESGL